jgi:opacity protein-like surface antigen
MKSLGRFFILFVVLSLPAFAQDNELTLFAGGHFPGKINLQNATTGLTEITDPANVGVFGVRYGKVNIWGHEQTFAYTPNFLDSNSKSIILNSNIVIQAPFPVVRIYATAGPGTIISWGSGVSDLGTKFAFNYGGGVKVRPSGPVGVRLDARGYSAFGVQDQTLKMFEVTAGIFFAF